MKKLVSCVVAAIMVMSLFGFSAAAISAENAENVYIPNEGEVALKYAEAFKTLMSMYDYRSMFEIEKLQRQIIFRLEENKAFDSKDESYITSVNDLKRIVSNADYDPRQIIASYLCTAATDISSENICNYIENKDEYVKALDNLEKVYYNSTSSIFELKNALEDIIWAESNLQFSDSGIRQYCKDLADNIAADEFKSYLTYDSVKYIIEAEKELRKIAESSPNALPIKEAYEKLEDITKPLSSLEFNDLGKYEIYSISLEAVYLNSTNSFDEPEALPEMKSAMNDLKNALSAKDLNKCATAVNSFWQAYNSYYMTIRGYGFYLLEQVGNTVYLDAYTTNSAAKFMICRYNLRDIIYTSTEENEALYYAVMALDEAISGLTEKGDFYWDFELNLEFANSLVETFNTDYITSKGLKSYTDKLVEIRNLINSKADEETIRKAFESAYEILDNLEFNNIGEARNYLIKNYQFIEELETEKYQTESVENMLRCRSELQDIILEGRKYETDAALAALKQAVKDLRLIPSEEAKVVMTELEKRLSKEPERYTEKSWKNLEDARDELKTAIDGSYGDTELNIAIDKAKNALKNLEALFRKGDIDKDGYVTMADAVRLLRHVSAIEPLEDGLLAYADYDENGKIELSDAVMVLQIVAGLIEEDIKQ